MRKLFPSQLETERIFLVVREHWVRLVLKLFIWLMLVLALIIFRYYGPQIFPDLFIGKSGQIVNLFSQIYVIFLLLGVFIIWLLYYLNIQIITSLRVVDVSQQGLFSHTVSELHIDKIEDVTSKVTGILGTVFDFGMVFIQTAAAKERFEFYNVPHPGQIEKLVLNLYEQNSNFAREAKEETE